MNRVWKHGTEPPDGPGRVSGASSARLLRSLLTPRPWQRLIGLRAGALVDPASGLLIDGFSDGPPVDLELLGAVAFELMRVSPLIVEATGTGPVPVRPRRVFVESGRSTHMIVTGAFRRTPGAAAGHGGGRRRLEGRRPGRPAARGDPGTEPAPRAARTRTRCPAPDVPAPSARTGGGVRPGDQGAGAPAAAVRGPVVDPAPDDARLRGPPDAVPAPMRTGRLPDRRRAEQARLQELDAAVGWLLERWTAQGPRPAAPRTRAGTRPVPACRHRPRDRRTTRGRAGPDEPPAGTR